ncbi:MAG TPA: hypothetical protein VF573_24635 [Paraburkholderia sp.]|uniref:hypothetical protein n=1 Tax=Paraburkholderia sp. TaxID=1926495 RepID=UPI002ED0BBD6
MTNADDGPANNAVFSRSPVVLRSGETALYFGIGSHSSSAITSRGNEYGLLPNG